MLNTTNIVKLLRNFEELHMERRYFNFSIQQEAISLYTIISILRLGEKDRAAVTQLVISIVFQAKLKTPLFPPRQPCNQFVSSPRGSPRVRTPANCPRTLFHAQNHACTHACRPRSSAILGTNAPGSSTGWSVRRIS